MSQPNDHLVWELRELLEDFDVVFTGMYMVLIKRSKYFRTYKENIATAAIASSLRIDSLDYVRRRYLPEIKEPKDDLHHAYIESYKISKEYITETIDRLNTEDKDATVPGVIIASFALERLISSFFSAHLLYQLGNVYEGHAVSRLILEQIAWAYAVHRFDDLNKIKSTSPSKSIAILKKFAPKVARLYGFLSKKTHLDLESHGEFINKHEEGFMITYSHTRYKEYASMILDLADLFVLVWECTQYDFLDTTISVSKDKENILPKPDRVFLKTIKEQLAKFEQ